ncbi:lipase family protein [Chroococcidiopsis sp. CCNUC1]|uniref:lipase family protein n=1 Tax=Chroococcidiopsis sp. CCNUC1 TaxID=2653189 RepID=UPI002020FAC3|nr:lipase family protein [Chroococcidiopsis sp. CCNUC1]URD53540.1 lipase family protein [Chroococcidiopsis sp. CCNUC1]
MAKHYLIFIHGMGERKPDENPFSSYDDLWERIVKKSGIGTEEFERRFGRIYTDWHVDPLQKAANTLFDAAFPNLQRQPINPMRGIRGFINFFLGDVVAYVSEDVNFIRRTVWKQIWKDLKQPLEQDATYSIIAHSLGSAIAFDYLFHLFHPEKPDDFSFIPKPDPVARPEDRNLEEITLSPEEIKRLREQFCHFFTMGSPIGLFMMRKGSLWMEGEPFAKLYNPVRGEGRFWYNFWDSEDAIAYPLAELFKRNPENDNQILEDVPVETGFLIFDSHTRYWDNRDVAQKIASVIV